MGHEKIQAQAKEQHLHQELEIDQMINALNNSNMLACASSVCAFSLQNPSELQGRSSSTRKLSGLIICYLLAMVVEIIGGLESNSLAVLTDAAHMLSDVAGFAIALFAVWASGWKPTSHQSFGFYRLEVLGALLSVQLIWFVTGFLMFKAIDRMLHESEPIDGKVMFLVASFGFAINGVTLSWMGHHHHGHSHHHCEKSAKLVSGKTDIGYEKVQVYTALPLTNIEDVCNHHHEETTTNMNTNLSGGCKKVQMYTALPLTDIHGTCDHHDEETAKMNINLEGAYLHVVSDLIQSIGVMIAGAVIWVKPNWVVIDLICTSIFSITVLVSTKPMLANVLGILMERTPREIDIDSLENALKSVNGVSEVHDLHVWSITVGKTAMCCHVKVEPQFDSKRILHDIRQFCNKIYRINHVTVQIEQE